MFEIKYHLEVKGLNLNNLIKKLNEKNIELENLSKLDYDKISFVIKRKDFKKLKKQFGSNYKIKIIKKSGFFVFIDKIKSRFGLLIGFVSTLMTLVILSNTFMQINICAENNSEIESQIATILEKYNISENSVNYNVNLSEVQQEIFKNIKEASIVEVERDGIILNINVKLEEKTNLSDNVSYVSRFDGIITDIQYGAGILNINVGDLVKSGQILLESGFVGDVYHKAQGRIFADAYVVGSSYGLLESVSVVRTGNVQIINDYSFANKKLFKSNRNHQAKVNFDLYETEQKETIIIDFLVPIKKVQTIYYELGSSTISKSYENLVEELKVLSYNDAVNKIPKNAEIKEVKYDIIQEGNFIKVNCNIITNIEICDKIFDTI